MKKLITLMCVLVFSQSLTGCMLFAAALVEGTKAPSRTDPMSCYADSDCAKWNGMYCRQAVAGSGTCMAKPTQSPVTNPGF
jgi:hypothetical protein